MFIHRFKHVRVFFAALDLQLSNFIHKSLQVYHKTYTYMNLYGLLSLYLIVEICDWYSKCGKILSMDKESALILPPVQRPYRNFLASKNLSQSMNDIPAYHIGCFPKE